MYKDKQYQALLQKINFQTLKFNSKTIETYLFSYFNLILRHGAQLINGFDYLLWFDNFKLININYKIMIKQQQTASDGPIYKKIQNYIFKFSDLLGQGNFSKVYRAHNEISNEIVAIKIVELQSLKSKKLEELLFSQIDVLKKLSHPNVLKCYEVFTSNRNCYIITELCNEGDLESRLRKERYFDEYKAEPIIKDIYEGLHYLAQKNVIHRDLKVANVFLHNSKAKIADFGFAKFTKQKFKDINIGSPIYMSPEGFIHNIYGPKTDVWAFGVLIYELLHGQTPYSTCRTENQLKQNLSIPISKHKFKSELSHEIKDVIMRCLEIDQNKRISISQLANTNYFRRIMGKDQIYPHHQVNTGIHSSALELRLRSPSYSGDNNKFLKSQQAQLKRKISAERPPANPFNPSQQILKINNVASFDKQTPNPIPMHQTSKNLLQMPSEQNLMRDRRAVSTQKPFIAMPARQITKHQKSPQKIAKKNQVKYVILSGSLSFKECVNILHYGRLIFKFLLTLKISQYSNDNELFKLSKWLMELLSEINEKIEKKEIVYEGQNAPLRQQKLKQVRNQYEKKYKSELSNYIRQNFNYGQQDYTVDYIKNYCYNLYQKYDGLISKQNNKSLIMLGHCIIMMCDAIRLLSKCYSDSDYSVFMSYKDIQIFLSLSKDQIDINSYLNYRKKMVLYS